ncbi:hypothetical protein SNEBB_009900 [Seison nebaliae]|nr:hypothetical protein SNEBB_009900 [Seison nebaliae]
MDIILIILVLLCLVPVGYIIYFSYYSKDRELEAVIRERLRNKNPPKENVSEDENEKKETENDMVGEGKKIGAKKRRKIVEKEMRREEREREQRERGEKKKKEAEKRKQEEDERIKKESLAKEKEEKLKKEREEEQKAEELEYLKWKSSLNVVEEGDDNEVLSDLDTKSTMYQQFKNFVIENKIVRIDEIASIFGMKTHRVRDVIQLMESTKDLTGFFDDRGKYISLEKDNIDSILHFINRRGRLSINDLAEKSSEIIQVPQQTLNVSIE